MSLDFVRKTVREMEGYTPGEQPPAAQRVVKLNTNENPYPPSEEVMRVLRELPADALRRYPNPTADDFRAAAAQTLGVDAEMILAGNGSDDILTIVTRTVLGPGQILAFPEPTYSLYPVLDRLQDAKIASVEWGKDFTLPSAALLATGARAIYLANPNSPTGTMVAPAEVAKLAAAFEGLLLVDEAYVDFADANCLWLVRDHANVVIARTLSKAYSLAGLRFGYAVAQPQMIHEMRKVKDSYNCDAVAIAAATAAIRDQEYARQTWEKIRRERGRVSSELNRLGWAVLPSQANFVLAACPTGRGQEAYLALKSRGILVRFFDLAGLRDKLRITIGTPAQNDALLAAIAGLKVA